MKDERNIARRVLGLIVLSFFNFQLSISAQPATLTTEQEQQFTYYWYAAKQAITEERYGDAYALLEFCRMIKPDDGQTLSFLGILYKGAGSPDRALQAFKQAFEADPRDQWYRYYSMLMGAKNYAGVREAQKVLEEAYEVQKKGKVDEELLVAMRLLYTDTQQWKKALAIQDQIEKRQGYDDRNAIYRYHILSAQKKEKQAIQALETYLAQDPGNEGYLPVGILNNYAYYLATHKGDLKKAERLSEKTIREHPDNPVYLDTYGWILHLQGQKELALFYLQRAENNAGGAEEVLREIRKHIRTVKSKK